MRLLFANGIYFKVASQVNVKTQIELEIWANCSGHRRKKTFRRTFFYAVQISKFWISLFLRVFKIAMLALISRFCANRKYEQVSLFCMEWLGLNPSVTSCPAFTVTLSHRFLNQTGLKEKCFIYRGGSSSLLLSNSPISRFSKIATFCILHGSAPCLEP